MGDNGRGMSYYSNKRNYRDTNYGALKMSDHFKSKNTPAPGALMPADAQEVMRKYHESQKKTT